MLLESEKIAIQPGGMEDGRFFATSFSMTNELHPRTTAPKSRTPEQRLMAAVLEDAIDMYRHPARNRRRLGRETEAWFRSDDRSWLFSFVRICSTLGLDPNLIRASLEAKRLAPMVAA